MLHNLNLVYSNAKKHINMRYSVIIILAILGNSTGSPRAQTNFSCAYDGQVGAQRSSLASIAPLSNDVNALVVFVRLREDFNDPGFVSCWDRPLNDPAVGVFVEPAPQFANELFDPRPANFNPTTFNPSTLQARTVTRYFYEQSRTIQPHFLFGDVWPKNAQQVPMAYVSSQPASYYQTRGYAILVEEILLYLETNSNIDFSKYDMNGDNKFDQIIINIRSSINKIGAELSNAGESDLYGYAYTTSQITPTVSVFGGIEVDYNESGQVNFVMNSCFKPQGYTGTQDLPKLISHEYVHDQLRDKASGVIHLSPIGHNSSTYTNLIPSNEGRPPNCGGTCTRVYEYVLMGGDPYGYAQGSITMAARERQILGWLAPQSLTTSAFGLTVGDLYSTGDSYQFPVGTVSGGRTRSLIIANRQRVGPFDAIQTYDSTPSNPNDELVSVGLMANGLVVEHYESGQPGYERYYDVLPADNTLNPGSFSSTYQGDLYGPTTKKQITPWTSPNTNACAGYSLPEICGSTSFIPSWSAIDDIRYIGNPGGDMKFDFYSDYRTAPIVKISADSWMGFETSHSSGSSSYTFNPLIKVVDGATLTIKAGTDLGFASGIEVEAGSKLVVQPGATLRLGGGKDIFGKGMISMIGTAVNPVYIVRLDSTPWGSLSLLANGNTLQHVYIDGGYINLSIRSQNNVLQFVQSHRGYHSLHASYNYVGGGRSSASISNSIFENATSIGVVAFNSNLVIDQTTIRNSGEGGIFSNYGDIGLYSSSIFNNGSSSRDGLELYDGTWLEASTTRIEGNGRHEVFASGNAYVDLSSSGYNSICDSGDPGTVGKYVYSGGSNPVYADTNWWGTPSPSSGMFFGTVYGWYNALSHSYTPGSSCYSSSNAGNSSLRAANSNPSLDTEENPAQASRAATDTAPPTAWSDKNTDDLLKELRELRAALTTQRRATDSPALAARLYGAQRRLAHRAPEVGRVEANTTMAVFEELRRVPGPARERAALITLDASLQVGNIGHARSLLDEHVRTRDHRPGPGRVSSRAS